MYFSKTCKSCLYCSHEAATVLIHLSSGCIIKLEISHALHSYSSVISASIIVRKTANDISL